MSNQGSFHSKPGIVVHMAAPWDSSSNDSWQQSKAVFLGDAKSKEQWREVSFSPAWAGCLSLTTRKVAIFLCSSWATYQRSRENWEEAKYHLSPVPYKGGTSVWPIRGPKRKEYEQGMAPVKLTLGYFGCGRSPVSESGGISVAVWGARWSFGTAGQRITAILYHHMTLKGELVKEKIHSLNLRLTKTVVWCQSSSNSRRNSIVYLSCLLFPFTSSFLLECKEKWKLLTENQMMKLL